MSEEGCWCPCHKDGHLDGELCCYCHYPEAKYKKLVDFVKSCMKHSCCLCNHCCIVCDAKDLLVEIGEWHEKAKSNPEATQTGEPNTEAVS